MNQAKSILLFDGICNLCNGWVKFIIRRDPGKHFKFASLQSLPGQTLLQTHNLPLEQVSTLILIEEEKVYHRSTAVLRVVKRLKKPWPLLYVLWWIPLPIRDAFYNLVAKYRYRLFGKRNSCMIPTAEVKERFLS